MDFEEIIVKRQSCRSFDPARPAEPEAVDRCLKAAMLAPSAVNAQPYRFWLATGDAAITVSKARSLGMNGFIEDCTTFIIITESKSNMAARLGSKLKDQDFRSIDIGIACAYLTAEATEQGLDTCILGMFDEKKIQMLIGTDDRVRLIIAIGHETEGYTLRDKKRKCEEDILIRL